jgi:hypothetical protein
MVAPAGSNPALRPAELCLQGQGGGCPCRCHAVGSRHGDMPVGRGPPGRRRPPGRPLSRTQWELGCRGGRARIRPISRIHGPAWSESGWFNGTPGSAGQPHPARPRGAGKAPGHRPVCSRMCLRRSAGGGPGCWPPGAAPRAAGRPSVFILPSRGRSRKCASSFSPHGEPTANTAIAPRGTCCISRIVPGP